MGVHVGVPVGWTAWELEELAMQLNLGAAAACPAIWDVGPLLYCLLACFEATVH